MSATLECIAVDDEPLALGLVCAFVEKTPFLNLAGRYSSAVEALQMINSKPIDVIFLDIQMPDLTGIELARVLEKAGNKAPRIIFTTAFNQYALDGFRVDAIDYLLKPFNYEEFLRAASQSPGLRRAGSKSLVSGFLRAERRVFIPESGIPAGTDRLRRHFVHGGTQRLCKSPSQI